MGNWTSSLMCTQQYCPCTSDVDFSQWKEVDLNKWERTNDVLIATTSGYSLLYKNVSGGYATFKECY
jgi:hypothetical protein